MDQNHKVDHLAIHIPESEGHSATDNNYPQDVATAAEKPLSMRDFYKPRNFFPIFWKRMRSKPVPNNQIPMLQPPKKLDEWHEILAVCIGVFLGLLLLAGLTKASPDYPFLSYSFGATVVLLFAAPNAMLAQPWNVFMGQLISTVISVTIRVIFDRHNTWISGPLACALALGAMMATGTTHPPGNSLKKQLGGCHSLTASFAFLF
jgi:CBS-domain-containing membrane protein